MKGWKKKRLFTFLVNGERRSLGWNKVLYREWFRFAQLSPLPIPIEFGDLSVYGRERSKSHIDISERTLKRNKSGDYIERRFNKGADKDFEIWWKLKRDLFIEPLLPPPVNVLSEGVVIPHEDYLTIRVDLRDYDRAVFELENLMLKHKREVVFKSKALFQPSIDQRSIQLRKLLTYRIAYELFELEGLDRVSVAFYLMDLGLLEKPDNYDEIRKTPLKGGLEAEVKRVSFFLGRARAIFKNIENGKFP